MNHSSRPSFALVLLSVLATLGMAPAAADSSSCTASPCLTPSTGQADSLFGQIEKKHPTLFANGSSTQTQSLAGSVALYRSYSNSQASGLATYQGGLWYAVNGQWQRYSSLDTANTEFCAGTCWGTTLSYPVVGTGQNKTYNATTIIAAPAAGQSFYGQDAQITGTAPSYSVSSDGKTVRDNTTRLVWMRGPNLTLKAPVASDKLSRSAALSWVNTVNAANYGGYSDWRLPSIKELYSLMNFQGTDPSGYTGTSTTGLTPFIDTSTFNFGYGQTSAGERIIDAQYASSTLYVSTSQETGSAMLFGLNLADGRIKGYDLTLPGSGDKTFFVQLVRGDSYGQNSFTDNGNGTITDAATGLMWAQDDSGSGMNWQDALAWVQARNATKHLGYTDWRLPNAKELQSLLNYANGPDYNGQPAIDTRYFRSTTITNENGDNDYPYYWTATTHAAYNGSGSAAVYIAFGRALGYSTRLAKWVDVHGAGAQRSDPKTSPPYTAYDIHTVSKNGKTYTGYAHGPQGDAIRGLNYVRLVRGGS